MSSYSLVIVDTVGIQSYIFGSNRLRENIGGSHLVHLATEGWLLGDPDMFLPQPHNIANGQRDDTKGSVVAGNLTAELIYAGGGNSVILFEQTRAAQSFLSKLSVWLIEKAPGLNVAAVIEDSQQGESLAVVMQHAFKALAKKKLEQEYSQTVMGLGVTVACRSTGLVANTVEREPGESEVWLPISAEVQAKWENNEAAKDRLSNQFGLTLPADYDFPDQFDDLGRTEGDHSYIAVVHADGNGMGRTLEEISESYALQGVDKDAEYVEKLRDFSDRVNTAGLEAMRAVVEAMVVWNQNDVVAPKKTGSESMLSLRPLVYGGDDVAFVCDGRLGLKAAQVFLEAFNQQDVPSGPKSTKKGIAAAGVAIVKSRYPFARAYQMAEALCQNAKNRFDREVPALDWHLAQSGLFGELAEIRQQEYREIWSGSSLEKSLLMRPISITVDPLENWRTWDNFVKLIIDFKADIWPRNKVMALREDLRSGRQAVERFTSNSRQLPKIKLASTEYRHTGWHGQRCVYFDAIEMIEQEGLK